jgi:uncharacterized membrane protein YhhN
MTFPAAVALALTAAATLVDWFAVARDERHAEYFAKPGVMLGLIAVALLVEPASGTERAFFVVALLFGLASDVFLMLPRDMFLAGLVAALLEHIAYIAGFRARWLDLPLFIAGAAVALMSAAVFLPPIVRALRRTRPKLVVPVLAYVAVFAVMVAAAGGSGSIVGLGGALLFLYSDAILAWNRFVRPLPGGRLVNMVPYHVGEALIVLALVY